MAIADDREAFRLLVDQHADTLWRVGWRMTGNDADADEVVQETFLRAWRELPAFQSRSNMETWLVRICVNCVIDIFRERQRQPLAAVEPDDAESHDPQPDRLYFSSEVREHVLGAMEQLTGAERTAFVLRHFEDAPNEEIGRVLGIKPNAVKQATFRAVRKLRAALEPLVRSADACDGRTSRPARLR